MPRGPGGAYQLPAGNPVVPGTIIESDWANPTMSDIGQEVTDSLSRSGKGGMLAALRGLDGSAAVPTFSFTNEPATGRYRAGPGQIVESVDGTPVVRYLSSGLEQWDDTANGGAGGWVPLTPRDALGTPFDPAPSNLTSTNVQDAIEEVNDKTGGALSADAVTYDDTNVYFAAGNVQQALDAIGGDIPGLAQDIADNADAILLLEGSYDLLEGRIEQNEINIGNNTTDISLNKTRIDNHDIDIDDLQSTQSSILLEQQQQNSDIQGNFDYVDATYNITQTNADDISSNLSKINTNITDINTLDGRVDGYDSIFPGGVLQPANGGTGTSSSTGTGAIVKQTGPFISSGTSSTPSAGSDSGSIANTEWVRDFVDSLGLEARYGGSNGNGSWIWFEGTENMILQYGTAATSGGYVVRNFPVAHNNSFPIQLYIQMAIDGGNGPWDTAPVIRGLSLSQFAVGTDNHFYWLSIGAYT